MSRSRKRHAVFKDKGSDKQTYWRTVRRRIKKDIHNGRFEYDILFLSEPKTIVNDYEYSDYTIKIFDNPKSWMFRK